MEIRVLEYDPETDELDLLIGVEQPVPAESVSVGEGVYVRRDPETGKVVGAMIRGYRQFVARADAGEPFPRQRAGESGLEEVLDGLLAWQKDLNRLAQELYRRVEGTMMQPAFWEALTFAGRKR